MLRLGEHTTGSATSWSRRTFLEIGSVSFLGLTWPKVLEAAERKANTSRSPRARSCVVIFLWGGPGQQDLWDPKPNAPAEIRSLFRPMATRVPGISISDQLPHLARQMDKYTLVRSVTHKDFEHGSAAYTALTGHPHPFPGTNTPARPDDFPTYGAIVTRLHAQPLGQIPRAVTLGPVMHQGSRPPIAGQNAGFLGQGCEPFRIPEDPNNTDFCVESLEPQAGITAKRLADRRQLLSQLDRHQRRVESSRTTEEMDELYQRAFGLLYSSDTRKAFDIAGEPLPVRERYGRNRFGQSLLLARRLVEAGVPLITVNWARQNGDQWDTHKNNYPKLKELLPRFDVGLAAFLADLSSRGLLSSTLVYCLGEFGRTPKMNKDAGRDHWPDCYSVLMGGGGIRTGTVFGSSDTQAAYPTANPLAPWDLAATLYHCLGIEPRHHLRDHQDRPWPVSAGSVVQDLLM